MSKKKIDESKLTDEEKEALKKERVTNYAKKDIFLDVAPYLIILFFVAVIRIFLITPVDVNGTSMYPTLHDGDIMLLYKLTKRIHGIKRYNIVVINTDSGKLIKRVIGLPGETIKYEVKRNSNDEPTEAILYVDGKKTEETFFTDESKNNAYQTCINNPKLCDEGIQIPDGEYFVMGDNRGNSKDSRIIGTIKYDDIIGTTNVIVFPFSRFGSVK